MLERALEACRIIDEAVTAGHPNSSDLILHLLSAVEPARAALKEGQLCNSTVEMAECAAFSAGYEAGEQDGQDAAALPQAAQDVLAERRRQIEAEGWTPEHDDEHDKGEMALAAAVYAGFASEDGQYRKDHSASGGYWSAAWPWDARWWKPSDRRRDLVKAGALILAEIERLDRAALAKGGASTAWPGDGS